MRTSVYTYPKKWKCRTQQEVHIVDHHFCRVTGSSGHYTEWKLKTFNAVLNLMNVTNMQNMLLQFVF